MPTRSRPASVCTPPNAERPAHPPGRSGTVTPESTHCRPGRVERVVRPCHSRETRSPACLTVDDYAPVEDGRPPTVPVLEVAVDQVHEPRELERPPAQVADELTDPRDPTVHADLGLLQLPHPLGGEVPLE